MDVCSVCCEQELLELTTKMVAGCKFVAVALLVCTFNALEFLDEKSYKVTFKTRVLQLDYFNGEEYMNYDEEVWPLLEKLWMKDVEFNCKEGLCMQDSIILPSDLPISTALPTHKSETSSKTKISDVAIVMSFFGSIITVALCFCLAICMDVKRKCWSRIKRCCCCCWRRRDEEDVVHERSMMDNLSRVLAAAATPERTVYINHDIARDEDFHREVLNMVENPNFQFLVTSTPISKKDDKKDNTDVKEACCETTV